MQPNFPQTPPPRTAGTPLITDFFKPIHHSEPTKNRKRRPEDEKDSRPAKKLRSARHAGITTARISVDIDRPKRRRMPASARLLDDSDSGLRDSLVGRWDLLEEDIMGDEENVVDSKSACAKDEIEKSSLAVRLRSLHNTRRPKKRPSSARLLDDVDGGLMDSLAGRFETTRYEEEIEENKEVNEDGNPEYDASTNQSPTNNTSIGVALAGDTEDNITNPGRYTTPSPRPLPTTPEHHGHQKSNRSGQFLAGDSPSSLLLPSPVMDLPVPSSPLLFSSSPIAWPSPPSSQ